MATNYAVVIDGQIALIYDTLDGARSATKRPGGVDAGDIILVDRDAYVGAHVAWYYDAESSRRIPIVYTHARSMAGRVSGVEYRVSYRLPSGQWINGVRHTDRSDLMTDVAIAAKPWVK